MELLGRLPEQLKPEQNKEPFTIVFPPENSRVQPITVSFGDGGFVVTLRGQEYFVGEQRRPGMNITATYKFVKTPEGYQAVRQGDLQIYGFGLMPGAKRSFRQQGIYTGCRRSSARSLRRRSSCRASNSTAASWPRPDSSCRRRSSRRTAGWRSVIAVRSQVARRQFHAGFCCIP